MACEALRRRTPAMVFTASLCVALCAQAEDTDIYVGRIPPPTSEPLIMFSVDNGSALNRAYAGCDAVGSGSTMCAPAKYFKAVCAACTLPAATQPLTYRDAIRFALRIALLETSGVKIGLMLNHNHESGCAGPQTVTSSSGRCSNGGYIARGFRSVDKISVPLTNPPLVLPGPNLQAFLSVLEKIPPVSGGSAHPYQGKELFFELFRYLTGNGIYNSRNGYTDYGTDTGKNLDEDNAAVSWDVTIVNPLTKRYVSPLIADLKCARIFTVNFLLSDVAHDGDSDGAIQASSGGMAGISLKGAANDLATVVGYLNDIDLARDVNPLGPILAIDGKQNVTSFFFAIPTPPDSDPPRFDQKTARYAELGGSNRPLPLSEDPSVLVDHLRGILSQVGSISTTFVSPSVPVNAFNRTQSLDETYLALFRPDSAAKPFWPGNIKKLKLQTVAVPCSGGDEGCTPGKTVRVVDALGQDAIGVDGRIRNEALTFWTDGAAISPNPARGVVAGRDGRHVELGGAGQNIPGIGFGNPGTGNAQSGARQMYLYPGVGDVLVPLNVDTATTGIVESVLGILTSRANQVLRYLRGFDAYDADFDLNTGEVRPWLMADPMHSRPLPINYGALGGHSEGNPAIYIAVGTNAGMLHFIRNTDTGGSSESGREAWAFVPVELLRIVEKLGLNNPLGQRLYGLDGTPAAYILDHDRDGTIESTAGDRVYLYVGMRRGGRAYYALDVTNPESPKFLWKIDPLTPGFGELGYTFSTPRVGEVYVDGGARPAVFFGGGYDLNKDYPGLVKDLLGSLTPTSGTIGTNDAMGNAIYVVDAATGELIWKATGGSSTGPSGSGAYTHAGLKDSIPSNLSIVDTDGDAFIDRIVVGDTGGNVWRADLGATTADAGSAWKLTLVAQLGRHADSGKVNDRRFFHEPDLVRSRDELGPFDAIVIGSGDRADPLDYGRSRTVGVSLFGSSSTEQRTENRIFMLKDRQVGVGSASGGSVLTSDRLADVSDNCLQGGASEECAPDLQNGWYIGLTEPGEKVLSAPLTAAGRVFLTTYVPTDLTETTSCGPAEGSGRLYALGFKTGTAAFNFDLTDGGSESGGANTASDRFEVLSAAGIPSDVSYLSVVDRENGGEARCLMTSDLACRSVLGATHFRTYWYREE